MTDRHRTRVIARLSQRLVQRTNPRLQMTLMLVATGTAGVLASFIFLHFGVEQMALRYPLAVGFSYGVFFILMRFWIACQQQDRSFLRDSLDWADLDPSSLMSGRSGGGSEQIESGWTDLLPDLGGDEVMAVVMFLLALIGALGACLIIVVSAPTLLAEVFLDAVVIAGLRNRLMRGESRHWTRAALRRTILPALLVAALFSTAGVAFHSVRPEAKSIGEVIHPDRSRGEAN